MRVDSPDWTPAAAQTLVANYETATALRSWRLELGTNGKLTLAWSEDGTAVKTAQSSVAVGATEGTPIWIKVVHDVDNDASGNDVIFYTSTDQTLAEPTSWTQLGTTVTTATATSHYATTAPYTLGGYNAVGAGKFTGDIYIVHVKNGIAGYDVVPCFPEHWDFYGGTGSATVKYSGSSVLTLLNSSQSGQNVAYWDDATRRVRATPPQGQQLFFISTGHNDSNMQGNLFIAAMQTFVDHLKTIKSGVPFVIVSQNPVAIVAGSAYFPDSTYQYSIDIRQGRQKKILSWASSQAGVYPLDTQRAFDGLTLTDYLNSDGLHPNAAGSQVWGEFVYDQLFSQ
jgi:lysophospholipase L1-like esterase